MAIPTFPGRPRRVALCDLCDRHAWAADRQGSWRSLFAPGQGFSRATVFRSFRVLQDGFGRRSWAEAQRAGLQGPRVFQWQALSAGSGGAASVLLQQPMEAWTGRTSLRSYL